ncbi:MAG: fibronectin type III domain-containing protein, partial [Acidimicrobiia bacterium]|nr:fibronectin type III domain-containing protein [Acidimicrobiia bacterium]
MTARSRTAPPRSLLFLLLVALLGLTAPDSTALAQTPGPAPQYVPVGWSLIPDGLEEGDQFRLLFVTSGTRNAQSSDIADYNTFVQSAANSNNVDATIRGMSGEFRAVISTSAVHARDNTATHPNADIPIYWLDGDKVADDYADFYDGSWDSLEGKSQRGQDNKQQRIWTGTQPNGTRHSNYAGSGSVRYGSLALSNPSVLSHSQSTSNAQRNLYALSPVLTVGTPPTPPPPLTYEVPNDWALKPSGLGVDDEFRLLIITSTQRDATSANIVDYNTHVTNAVAAGHDDIRAYSKDFRALASTEGVDARDNTVSTGTGVDIYWLGGAKVADDYADFYDGSWIVGSNVARDEDGDTFATSPQAWTGSGTDGTEYFSGTTSEALGSAGNVTYGQPGINAFRAGNANGTESRGLIGLSPVFKVVDQGAPAVQTVPGDWPLIPSDHSAAGAQFRLLFITSGERDATSLNIGDYNAFVQGHAGSGHEAIRPYHNEFRALASTAAVDANDNTGISGTGVRIYALRVDASGNFNGHKIADNYADLCDGDWDNTARWDESGGSITTSLPSDTRVWTGTDEDTCEGASGDELGSSSPRYGLFTSAGQALDTGNDAASSNEYRLYALSPVFEVSSAPTAPTAFAVSDVTDVSARVSWGEPSFTGAHPIFQYQVQVRRCLSNIDQPCTSTSWTGWGDAASFGGAARSGVITTYLDDKATEETSDDETLNLTHSNRYQARVQARGRENPTSDPLDGEWSEAKAFRTGPARPIDLLATPGDTQISLTWRMSSDEQLHPVVLSHFTVEYADNAAFTNPQRVDTASSDVVAVTAAPTELTVTGLTNEVEYHFRVRSALGTATSRWSASVTATPAPATDYDADDGLIDVERLAQLNGIRYDLDGDGVVTDDTNTADLDEAHAYLIAFPNPVAGMGCPLADHNSDPNTAPQPVCTGYELTADLDFDENGNNTRDDTYNTDAGWDPIGDDSNPYAATFEGNGDGHTISNLFINRGTTDYVGLFGSVASGGAVRNLGVADAVVTGRDHVGVLAGENEGRVSASWASGRVTGRDDNVGGLVGQNEGVIAASYSSAGVTATGSDSLNTGGLVGWNRATASILASYATGAVSGPSHVGGLVGSNEGGVITASYSTGAVSSTGSSVGGLVGSNPGGTVTDSYWDTERSELTTSAAGTGKTGAELRAPTAYGTGTAIYANWNLDLDNADNDDTLTTGTDNPWDFGADYNYPTLRTAGGKQKAPGPVSGLTAAPNDQGTLVVTWTPPTDEGDGTLGNTLVGVYATRYTDDGAIWIRQGVSQGAVEMFGPTFTIASPTANSYRIELWALGGGTAHAEGKRVSIELPGPPRMSLMSSSGRVDVSWSAPEDTGGSDISGYRMQYRLVEPPELVNGVLVYGSWTTLTLPGTTTSRSITGLTAGETYEFQLAATNADGTGVYAGPLNAVASDVVNYDSDGNGLIEIRNLAQLHAVRWDADGDGVAPDNINTADIDEAALYAAAFPQAATGMGCPGTGCIGYELMVNLDFDTDGDGDVDGNDSGGLYWNGGEGWEPLGKDPRFTAVFEGNGRTIANLFINDGTADRLGLFSRLGDNSSTPEVGATVRNLVLTGANVTGDDRIGILAGQTYSTTVISNVSVSGIVDGDDEVGGLVGETSGDTTISNSSAFGSVTAGPNYTGGLVGQNEGAIAASYAAVAVSGQHNVGGLVGRNEGGAILASYATGSVTGTGSNVAGLVGVNVTGGDIIASYSTGAVSGSGSAEGGMVGNDDGSGTISNSYWDTESSEQTTSSVGTGKTSEELRQPTGYTGIYSAWNLDLDNADGDDSHATGPDNPWDFGRDYNYPTLRNAPGNQKRPGPVRNMSVGIHTGIGGNRVVAWLSPSDSGDGSITGYEYRISTDGGSTWPDPGWTATTGLTRSFNFTAQSGNSYTIEARAVSDAAHQLGVSRSVGPPQNAPRNLDVRLYTTRVDLFWDAPQDDGGPAITGYAVEHSDDSGGTTWLTTGVTIDGRKATIEGLTDGTTYNLRVAAVSLLGPGTAYATIDAEPTATPRNPGAPTDLKSTPGQGTITLSWKAPEDLGNPPLTSYTVQWRTVGQTTWPNQATTPTTTRTINISGDGPFEVRVGAVNTGTTTYMTAQRVEILRPPGAPRHLGLYPGDGRIEVAWTAPADQGIPAFESYLLQYRKSADRVWQNWPHSRTDADRQRTEITGLDNGAEYLVRVAAVSSDGAGAFAKGSATPFRLQDLPGVPRNLQVYASDSRLDVRWEAPDDLGDPELTHYRVSIRQEIGGAWRGGIPRTVDAPDTATVYKNLVNGRSYQVHVAACNRWGCGPSTSPVAATPQEGLERPDIERPPSAPRDLTLTPGDGYIKVSWKAPADPGKPAAGAYLVEHRRAGTSDDWTRTRTGRTTATLRGLTNGQAYEVQVTAYNDHGGGVAGPHSAGPAAADAEPEDTDTEPEPEDTEPGSERPPTAPRNLRLEAGDGWIKVSWNTPRDIGDPDAWIGYSVETRTVGAAGSGGWFEEGLYRGTSATIDATNGQSHQVRVIAVNEHGQATAGPHTARPTAPEPDED